MVSSFDFSHTVRSESSGSIQVRVKRVMLLCDGDPALQHTWELYETFRSVLEVLGPLCDPPLAAVNSILLLELTSGLRSGPLQCYNCCGAVGALRQSPPQKKHLQWLQPLSKTLKTIG